jgi:ABC-type multidrug transport system permease subunit
MGRGTLFIARADLSQLLRSRESVLWLFVMPVLFFYFFGTVTGGFGRPTGDRRDLITLRVTERDTGFVVDELVRRLEGQQYAVRRATTDEAFRTASRRLRFEHADGSTASLTDDVLAGRQVKVVLETGSDPLGARYHEVRVSRAVYGLLADLAVVRLEGQVPSASGVAAVAKRPRALRLSVTSAGHRVVPPSGFSQAIPGTMVMFTMLVLLTGGAATLVTERESGLLKRVASTPISRGSVVAGKWLARVGMGAAQLGVAVLVGAFVFGLDWGDSKPMVLAVLLAWAAFNASLALLLANLARSAAQMAGLGVMASMVLAALGGCWWPVEIAPAWMQTLALALPTGWCMDALHQLVNFGDPAASAAPHLLALVAGALALGWVGVRTFRYQ